MEFEIDCYRGHGPYFSTVANSFKVNDSNFDTNSDADVYFDSDTGSNELLVQGLVKKVTVTAVSESSPKVGEWSLQIPASELNLTSMPPGTPFTLSIVVFGSYTNLREEFQFFGMDYESPFLLPLFYDPQK
jgi:hypothetical protein